MISPAIFKLAIKSVWHRRTTAVLTMVSIALAVMLFAGVEKIRQSARESFERTVYGVDLIVGGRTGPINLVLYSVFRIGDATNNIRWASYEAITQRPDVEWAVPISLGDSHRGYRVVGTTGAYFDHYRYGEDRPLAFSDGVAFDDLYDVVLGAAVARELGYALGDSIILSHGIGAVSFSDHTDKPFTIVGVLAPTGTPVDRSVHVSLAGIEAIHLGWESGAPTAMAKAIDADMARNMDLQPKQITAILLGVKGNAAVFRLQRDINATRLEPLLAVRPATALLDLWRLVSGAERALAVVSAFVIVVGLFGVMTSILTSLNERRREMAILRAVGARPVDIFVLLTAEAGALALVGAALGLCLLYGSGLVIGPIAQTRFGVGLSAWGPSGFDAAVLGGVTAAALALGAIPAWQAFRRSLADGLTVKF